MLELGQEWLLYITPFRMKETDAPSGGEILSNAISLYAKDRSGTSGLYWMNDAGTEFDLAAMATGTGVAGRVAFWSGTSTLSSDADLTFATDTLTATKLTVPTLATFTAAATFSFLTAGRIPYAGVAGALSDSANLFWDNSNTRFGLGTSSPSFPFHLVTQVTGFKVDVDNYNDTFGNIISLRSAKNTLASPGAVTADFGLGRIAFSGWTSGSAFSNQTAIIQALAAENYTGSNQGTYINFMTTATGATSVTERFRIGPVGQWGIGGATYGTANNIYKSGGASAAPSWGTVNILDSDSHGDTLTGTVVRGDLIVGNSTPKWSRFAKGSSGTILQMGANDPAWTAVGTAIDHGTIGGLGDDDHTQYALLAGRSGGQTLKGGTATGDDLLLVATSNASPSGANINFWASTSDTRQLFTLTRDASATYIGLYSMAASGQCQVEWYDGATRKWTWYKATDNSFNLYNDAIPGIALAFGTTSAATFAKSVNVNDGGFFCTSTAQSMLEQTTTNSSSLGVFNSYYQNSSSPANADIPYAVNFRANDSGATARTMAQLAIEFSDVTASSQDSRWLFSHQNNCNAGDVNSTALLSSLGVWTDASDANAKEFEGRVLNVLNTLKTLQVEKYRSANLPPSKVATAERHISPTAQDFIAAFGLTPPAPTTFPDGTSRRLWGIAAKDMAGIALTAIQEIIPRLEALEVKVGI